MTKKAISGRRAAVRQLGLRRSLFVWEGPGGSRQDKKGDAWRENALETGDDGGGTDEKSTKTLGWGRGSRHLGVKMRAEVG